MYIVILVTAKNKTEANRIAKALVDAKLAACVNIFGSVKSLFRWQGKVDAANETLLVIKSQRRLFKKIAAKVKSVHSYTIPEIIALPIVEGNADYLTWIKDSTLGVK